MIIKLFASIREKIGQDQIIIENESLKNIFEDMKKGILKKNLENISTINNRKIAIEKAIKDLKDGDVLLVAGKGHENYQIIKNKRIPFSDKKIILDRLSLNE